MKRTLLIIIAAFYSLCIFSQDVRISMKMENQPLKTILEFIEKESGYTFIYSSSHVDVRQKISVSANNLELKAVLNDICNKANVNYSIENKQILLKPGRVVSTSQSVANESVNISGVVRDNHGEPVIGASVYLADSKTTGTITDMEGKFSLNIPKNVIQSGKLIVSFVGMLPTEVLLKGKSKHDVTIVYDETMLKNVVVTGYQTLSLERTAGSFDKVDSKILASRPTSNIANALEGLVAGLKSSENPDGSLEFQIRGVGTLNSGYSPLVVVDGFPIQGSSLSYINPNDIENITILKDASAASIWGARSANGVIVVTTKKAAKTDRLKVNVQTFYRFAESPDLDNALALADARTQVDYEMMAIENNWIAWRYAPGSFVQNIQRTMSSVQELYYRNMYYGLSDEDMEAGLENLRNRGNRRQLKDLLMQRQAMQQYNISLSNSNEKSSNYLSVLYEKSDENTIKRGSDKLMVGFNNTYDVTPWLTFKFQTNLLKQTSEGSGVTINNFKNIAPYDLLLNDDGSYTSMTHEQNKLELEQMPLENFPYSDWSYNLLREIKGRDYKSRRLNYRIVGGLDFKIMDGLTFGTSLQYEAMTFKTRNYDTEDTYRARNEVNRFTPYDFVNGVVKGESGMPKGGIIARNESGNISTVFRNTINYDKSFANKHDIAFVAGFEMTQLKVQRTNYPLQYGYQDERGYSTQLNQYVLKDYLNKQVMLMSNTTAIEETNRYMSYFGNLGYTYDQRYNLSLSMRMDGANFISDRPSLRWDPMWSVGAKWNIRSESFMKEVKAVDQLMLRATYGLNGNPSFSMSPMTLLTNGMDYELNLPLSQVVTFGNPNIRWEKTYTTNIGLDFGLFNVLSGKIEFYNRESKDVENDVRLANVTGTDYSRLNSAEVLNRGVELTLGGNIRIPSIDFNIMSTVTYAYNKNKILKNSFPETSVAAMVGDRSILYMKDKPMGALYSFVYDGTEVDDNGNDVPYVLGVDGERHPMNNNSLYSNPDGREFLKYNGTTVQPHTFGWSNQFQYKGFSLNIFLTGEFGGVFRAPTLGSVPIISVGNLKLSKFISHYYESDGSNRPAMPSKTTSIGYFQNWGSYTSNLDYYAEDASYIRLKEISLNYSVPKKIISKIKLDHLSVFAQVRDLGLIYTANRDGYDPQWLPGTVKPSTTYTFGAKFSF